MALRRAKCISLSVSGKGNKIFRSEDTTSFFENEVDNFDKLIADGYIKLVDSDNELVVETDELEEEESILDKLEESVKKKK